jgi:hypothetical protein
MATISPHIDIPIIVSLIVCLISRTTYWSRLFHRYLWTGPSPLFLEHRFFFHVNNILQLSMYHWIQCNILQLSMYHWIQWYIESCKMLFTWKKISMFQEKGGGGPVHNYLWLWVICIFSSCHKILLYKVENILTDVRRK